MNKELITFILIICYAFYASAAFAGPSSTTYEIKDYTFGAGGTDQSGITGASNYTIFGTAGELDYGKLTSTTYGLDLGLTFTLKASVSAAPSFTNPATNYDRLKIVLDSAIGPNDSTYAIAISSDNFASDTRYIQSDYTVGSTLGTEDFLTYLGGAGTGWGGSSGFFVTGLNQNTTYYVKVKSRQGNFTESEYSTVASTTTSFSSLTFSLDSSALNFSNLNAGNSYIDNSKTSVLTTSTNAYNGYTVYGKEDAVLTASSGTISDYGGTNATPTTWSSGTGFGYTTNDNNLGGSGGATRFSSGTKYAGFTVSSTSPGNPVADNAGPIQDPAVSNEPFTITYKVAGSSTTPAGVYHNTVMYSIVPTYWYIKI